MKEKILFVITKSNFGGAQRYVFDVATNLPETYEAVVAFGGTGEKDAQVGLLGERLTEAGIRTVLIPAFMRDLSFFREWHALRQLVGLMRAERPHAVHLNSSKAGGLGSLAARIAGVKRIVFTVHGLPFMEDRPWWWRTIAYLGTWATGLLATHIITVSSADCERMKELFGCAHKISFIRNGIEATTLMERDAARTALCPEGAMDIPWIGTVAELTWNKGLHNLLRAASELKRSGNAFELCIIGEGEERTFLETLIDEEDLSGSVHLIGYVPNAAHYLKAFDIFALSSIKEGAPYVLAEAGLATCAVVASDVGGVKDVIVHGETGMLVKPGAPGALMSALQALLLYPEKRARLAAGLEERIRTLYTLPRMIDATVDLYR